MSIYSFLKNSTVIDFAFIFLTIFSSFALTIPAIVTVAAAKRRKWLYIFVAFALLPLIIGLAGATFRFVRSERLLAQYAETIGPEWVAEHKGENRTEFLITTGIGAAGTVLPMAIGLGGLVFKRNKTGV